MNDKYHPIRSALVSIAFASEHDLTASLMLAESDFEYACDKETITALLTELEDAQGEIRALRATEAGLIERVKELEEWLQSLASYPLEEFALESKPDNRQLFGANDWKLSVGNVKRARALLEKKE